ncbi:hypothetical protein U1Q18_009951 [Sarracenia purpurea var. burkii]
MDSEAPTKKRKKSMNRKVESSNPRPSNKGNEIVTSQGPQSQTRSSSATPAPQSESTEFLDSRLYRLLVCIPMVAMKNENSMLVLFSAA